jgi:hypothetical protein
MRITSVGENVKISDCLWECKENKTKSEAKKKCWDWIPKIVNGQGERYVTLSHAYFCGFLVPWMAMKVKCHEDGVQSLEPHQERRVVLSWASHQIWLSVVFLGTWWHHGTHSQELHPQIFHNCVLGYSQHTISWVASGTLGCWLLPPRNGFMGNDSAHRSCCFQKADSALSAHHLGFWHFFLFEAPTKVCVQITQAWSIGANPLVPFLYAKILYLDFDTGGKPFSPGVFLGLRVWIELFWVLSIFCFSNKVCWGGKRG